MDDHPDPILNFFSAPAAAQPDVLYTALQITRSATSDEIKKAYRKLALKYHPDKHASKSDAEREETGKEFQRIGFAYAVLSDEARRKRYDSTGRTDESAFADAEEMGWDAYFESLFQRVDRKMLDEDKARYQGSQEELDDLEEAYTESKGSLPDILARIPHSTHGDESRLIQAIENHISSAKLERTKSWTKTSKDQTASKARGKKAAKEAKEAEAAAKELGVWDEFYGSGAKGKRNAADPDGSAEAGKGKGQGKGSTKAEAGDGDSALAALILKRQRDREGGLNALEEKYKRIEEEAREKKRSKKGKKGAEEQENEGPPDISDADFEALQAKMFGSAKAGGAKAKRTKA